MGIMLNEWQDSEGVISVGGGSWLFWGGGTKQCEILQTSALD